MKNNKKDFLVYVLSIACRVGMVYIVMSDSGLLFITRAVIIMLILMALHDLEPVNRGRNILIERHQSMSTLVAIESEIIVISAIVARLLVYLTT